MTLKDQDVDFTPITFTHVRMFIYYVVVVFASMPVLFIVANATANYWTYWCIGGDGIVVSSMTTALH